MTAAVRRGNLQPLGLQALQQLCRRPPKSAGPWLLLEACIVEQQTQDPLLSRQWMWMESAVACVGREQPPLNPLTALPQPQLPRPGLLPALPQPP
jgi:hypothetical protein